MAEEIKIGIIGFDTSHVLAFTKLLSDKTDPHYVPGGKVVAGYPSFSPDLPSSFTRVEDYKKELTEKWGVKLVGSIPELLDQVDAVLLESVDGRRHLQEAQPVFKARKPVFIDKPLAACYSDAAAIIQTAKEYNCPMFSSSSLRFDANIVAARTDPELGRVLGCDAFSPASLDPTNPGLFWYGIHGVEILYTFMGTGCQKVFCAKTDIYHSVVGLWTEGKLGTVRGTRAGSHSYGATVFGEKKFVQVTYSTQVPFYAQLLRKIIAFFQGQPAPVPLEETLELMAFMQAAIISEQENREVALVEVMK
ncbi:MAG: Gfo/Idh/MocA family oxidoreductase [Candidatus Omnitrophica bacterium]|nr:Gfo/Idh/MocA family oxidoreductase [Candidatus Omnitrophota bacterium]